MKRETRKYITKLKKMSHEEIESELWRFVGEGQSYWDSYYRGAPIVDWTAEDALKEITK